MRKEIETAYAPKNDITFILEHIYRDNGDPVRTSVVGWYYGEPTAENTEYFYGKTTGSYD